MQYMPPKHLLSLILLALSALCALPATAQDPGSAVAPAAADPFADARETYEDTCAPCHGAAGEGSTKGPQILNPVAGYAAHVVRAGRDEMAEYPDPMPKFAAADLSDEDLQAVLAWLASSPKPEDGKGLFLRNCGNCHGPLGDGGRTGRDAAHEAHDGDAKVLKWIRKGHGKNDYSDRREYMPAWTADQITDADASKIAEYLRSVSKDQGDDKKKDKKDDD
jgi:mono/diheme cytochrome c family protein